MLQAIENPGERDFVSELIDLMDTLNSTLEAAEKAGFSFEVTTNFFETPRRIVLDLKRPVILKNKKVGD